MDYHLVCVHPFGKYVRGQMITDAEEWAELVDDHEHSFVRIPVPQEPDDHRTPLEREADDQAELARAEPKDPALAKALADGQAVIGKMATDTAALSAPADEAQPSKRSIPRQS